MEKEEEEEESTAAATATATAVCSVVEDEKKILCVEKLRIFLFNNLHNKMNTIHMEFTVNAYQTT